RPSTSSRASRWSRRWRRRATRSSASPDSSPINTSSSSVRGELRNERKRRGEGTDRRQGTEGGKHHVPVGGRAQGQAPLLRAGGAGQEVAEVGGVAAVVHIEEVRHARAASGSRPTRPAAGEDGRHDQLAGGDRGGRTHAGVGSGALRYQGLVERSHRGHVSIVRDRLLQIRGRGRRRRE